MERERKKMLHAPCWRPGCGSAQSHRLERFLGHVHGEVEVDYSHSFHLQKLPQLLAGFKKKKKSEMGRSIRIYFGTCLDIPVKTLEDAYRDFVTAAIRELAKLVKGSTLAVTEVTHDQVTFPKQGV